MEVRVDELELVERRDDPAVVESLQPTERTVVDMGHRRLAGCDALNEVFLNVAALFVILSDRRTHLGYALGIPRVGEFGDGSRSRIVVDVRVVLDTNPFDIVSAVNVLGRRECRCETEADVHATDDHPIGVHPNPTLVLTGSCEVAAGCFELRSEFDDRVDRVDDIFSPESPLHVLFDELTQRVLIVERLGFKRRHPPVGRTDGISVDREVLVELVDRVYS